MTYSLLAHLQNYIKGSKEDIATYALQYLLMRSKTMNRIFTNYLAQCLHIDLGEELYFISQLEGAQKERPDLSGFNENNDEVLICEMKLYASLTKNQPFTYLSRLPKGGGLAFICLDSRKTMLWSTLKQSCQGENLSAYCMKVDDVSLGVVTWQEILNVLRNKEDDLHADFLQLEGYLQRIEDQSFIPYSTLCRDLAKFEDRHYDVVDEVMALLLSDSTIHTSKRKLKATAYRKGYTRSLLINDVAITLNYDRDLWKRQDSIQTPFWLAIREKDWKQSERIEEILEKIPETKKESQWNLIFIGLEVLENAELKEVCEHLKHQILEYLQELL